MHTNDHSSNSDRSASRLTRRQVLGGVVLAASAASLPSITRTARAVSSDANDKVRAVLDALVRDTPEIGLQVAAYLDGKLVIDAWAGMADSAAGKPVDGDTLFMLSSTTKGVTATCMHLCVEKHGLSYDMPIVEVWPEFGAHGKQNATLRMALAHQTGVPQTPVGYTPEWLSDWDRMCRGIADLTPMFPIGERTAYHSLNYGHINGEILRRVDGRPIAQFLQEEICNPLGIDGAYLGVPDQRAAPRRGAHGRAAGAGRLRRPHGRRAGRIARRGGVQSARGACRRRSRARAGCSARAASRATTRCWPTGASSTACACSRKRASAPASSCRASRWDEIYRMRVRRALGYRRGSDTGPLASPEAFGHVGGGGSFGYADPAQRLAIGFAKNYFTYAERQRGESRPPAATTLRCRDGSDLRCARVADGRTIPAPDRGRSR